MTQPVIEYERGSLMVVRWERVIVTFVHGVPDLPFLESALQLARRMAVRDAGRLGSLTLATPSSRPPEGPARELAKDFTREAGELIRARATVITGQGFVASVARSYVTMVTSFSRGPAQKVFSEPEAAVMWLGALLEMTPASCHGLSQWCDSALARHKEVASGAQAPGP
jgi:hypothetical protein